MTNPTMSIASTAACCSSSACSSSSSSSSSSSYLHTDNVLNAMSIDFPQQQQQPPAQTTKAQTTKFARPRGLWKARETLASRTWAAGHASDTSTPPTPPTSIGFGKRTFPYHDAADTDAHSDRWHSPDPFSECEYDSDSSAASLSRHQHLYPTSQIFLGDQSNTGKRRRRDLDSPPTSLDERDSNEEVIYWDYSRKCTPNLEIEKDWTRSKLMDTSAISGSGPPGRVGVGAAVSPGALEAAAAAERASTDLEDWEDLKELFAKAAEMYESHSPSQTLPLLRGVIHECHRLMQLYHDPSVIYASVPPASGAPPPSVDKKIINDWLLAERLHAQHTARSTTSTSTSTHDDRSTTAQPSTTPAEKKCKCKDLPTAFYTILGTTLFFFGNIVDASPELCMPGEPANPVVYWLCTLDAFEIGESLPVRTSGRVGGGGGNSSGGGGDYFSNGGGGGGRSAYHARAIGATPPPEDWRMAVVWGRTLVCIAEEVVRRQHERAKQGLPPREPQQQLGFALAPGMQLANYADMVPMQPMMPTSPSAFPVQQQLAAARAEEVRRECDPNSDSPVWPANSPFATIVARRPALPARLSLESGVTPHELLLLAQDQFSRGILHMPHPQHLVHARFGGASGRSEHLQRHDGMGKNNAAVPDSFLFTPALGPSVSYEASSSYSTSGARINITAPLNPRSNSSTSSNSVGSHHSTSTSPPNTLTTVSSASSTSPSVASSNTNANSNTASHPSPSASPETFSRAKELYTIAYEVLLLSEKLDLASERQTWAQWADSVFSQMKMEADTDAWRGHITAARGRCCVVIGSALAEGVEERLERAGGGGDEEMSDAEAEGAGEGETGKGETEAEILESEEAREAREVLVEAIGYLERAKEVFEARKLEAQELALQGGLPATVVEVLGDGEGDDEEEEGMIVIEDADLDDEEEDGDEIVADAEDSSATPTPASTSVFGRGSAASPISHLRMPLFTKVSASTQTLTSTQTPSTTPAPTTTTSKVPQPPAAANPNNTTAEDEVEELKTLLAEALLSLANLTADKAEREGLYARAQKEGGDKFELDEWDEEDRMDED